MKWTLDMLSPGDRTVAEKIVSRYLFETAPGTPESTHAAEAYRALDAAISRKYGTDSDDRQ